MILFLILPLELLLGPDHNLQTCSGKLHFQTSQSHNFKIIKTHTILFFLKRLSKVRKRKQVRLAWDRRQHGGGGGSRGRCQCQAAAAALLPSCLCRRPHHHAATVLPAMLLLLLLMPHCRQGQAGCHCLAAPKAKLAAAAMLPPKPSWLLPPQRSRPCHAAHCCHQCHAAIVAITALLLSCCCRRCCLCFHHRCCCCHCCYFCCRCRCCFQLIVDCCLCPRHCCCRRCLCYHHHCVAAVSSCGRVSWQQPISKIKQRSWPAVP